MRAMTAVALSLAVWLGPGAGWAQGFGTPAPERFFRIESEVSPARNGRPAVRGYLYNNYGQPANRVQLLLESLDAAGQVTGTAFVHVDGIVPPFSRSYFDARVSVAGASYRLTVYSFEWLKGGGGM